MSVSNKEMKKQRFVFLTGYIARKKRLWAIVCVGFSACAVQAQKPAYIGFVYPAGGQQGTTVHCMLGGQAIDDVCGVTVSGAGVCGQLIDYEPQLNAQEMQVLREQHKELKPQSRAKRTPAVTNLIARLGKLLEEYVQQPQCSSIANHAIVAVTIDANALPGVREIRLVTARGLSNPLAFHIGQFPEVSGDPMPTSPKQILGKEAQSLRHRKPSGELQRPRRKKREEDMEMMTTSMATGMAGPEAQTDLDDPEIVIQLPCTINGQIASGSVDRYRFTARCGQRLVATVQARSLVPYLADAVPGWFQPVLLLCDAQGREVAYNDDYRGNPDPVLFCEIPEQGDYTLVIHDAIFRGREDFVYRITLGELPFVTSYFPLGAQVAVDSVIELKGVNLAEQRLLPAMDTLQPGIHTFTASGRNGIRSNPISFAIDSLPGSLEHEPNNTPDQAQQVSLSQVINGTIDTPNDSDYFKFKGEAGQEVVTEVMARRLGSPLDACLTILDEQGRVLGFNDDQEDIGSGLNTHHADAYLRICLPATGIYTVCLRDTQHNGGAAYAYRLRISAPQFGFDLRVVPSRVTMRAKGEASVTLHAIRKDGFNGTIRFRLKEPASGFTLKEATLSGTQSVVRVTIRTTLKGQKDPIPLVIEGVSEHAGQPLVSTAVGAEDCMQAFLWRHLVPTQEFLAYVWAPPDNARHTAKKNR